MHPNLIVAFFTGLSAGGIGCLVVQSGLLAGSLSRHFEGDGKAAGSLRPRYAWTISLFLMAKLAAYTFLGFLLGSLGSVLQLAPAARAALTIVIGIFIVGNGLRMLGVHPVFRWFVLEPPSGVGRFIRRSSRRSASPVMPLFLGAMTVLLPCGISQAMMATALGTGDPFQGAALLFAFTLGTIPVFFVAAYCATRLSAALEAHAVRVVAFLMIAMGAASILLGLNLAGMPVPLPYAVERPGPAPATPDANGEAVVSVSDTGYTPQSLHLPAGRPVTIVWATQGAGGCARSIVIPGLNYRTVLPATGRVSLTIPAQEPGTVLRYSCSSGLRIGRLAFDLDRTEPDREGR